MRPRHIRIAAARAGESHVVSPRPAAALCGRREVALFPSFGKSGKGADYIGQEIKIVRLD